jgi:uncharacterized membrane protein (UPF0127 family)
MRCAIVFLMLAFGAMVAACDEKPAASKPAETKPAEAKPVETKPAQTKPAETKPAETKPAEAKPAEGSKEGASSVKTFATPQPALPTLEVKLDGRTFKLEQATTDEQRFRGLSGRTEIAPDGGMIFLFRRAATHSFVMRDCPIPIDIVYVDATGRITAMHAMQPEPERTEAEKVLGPENAPAWGRINEAYESRLKKYSSKHDAIVVIEIKGGTLNLEGSNPKGLNLKVGQKLDLDMAELRKRAK